MTMLYKLLSFISDCIIHTIALALALVLALFAVAIPIFVLFYWFNGESHTLKIWFTIIGVCIEGVFFTLYDKAEQMDRR